ncbi:hypothetical protein GCM10011575_44960 [Microlunatus endophyticus]|uniref:Xylose isomerase-like TIM barrel domain-containing protein n=1 Tax=Microlunatus endophyticus TaxID=1716077 RepID=A0A917SJ16_9ACTN|nr:hypothetical protein GCM10011575_44960 [Microlunatus endophyticus]
MITDGMRRLDGTSFEVIFYSTWFDAAVEIADQIAATGAPTPVLHAEKSIGPAFASDSGHEIAFDRFAVNCRFARAIGAKLMVLHLWGLPDSDRRLDRNLAALTRLLDIAESYDLTLSIETLLCAVGTPLDAVVRCRTVDQRAGITLDTAFLAMHDQLGAAVTDDRLWPGVDHVHLKDYADPGQGWGTSYLHPGQGKLDLSAMINGLHTRGYTGTVTLEAHALRDDDTPDTARIEESLDWIRTTRSSAATVGS